MSQTIISKPCKVVIIDNYDSFTYNLAHLVKELGASVTVYRNDQFSLNQLEPFDKILLSPGPGIPSEAGLLTDVIRTYAGRKPMLGVCLGHQAIGEVFGARLTNLFSGLGTRFTIGRYHSWVVSQEDFPETLQITALSDDGNIMALRHRNYAIWGIQFHPESVLTPEGRQIIANWLEM